MKRRPEFQNVKPTLLILTFIVFSLFFKHEIRNCRIKRFFCTCCATVYYLTVVECGWVWYEELSALFFISNPALFLRCSYLVNTLYQWCLIWAWFLFFDMMRITLELVQCMIEPKSDGKLLLAATAANHKWSWLGNLGDLYKRPQRNWHADWKTVNLPSTSRTRLCVIFILYSIFTCCLFEQFFVTL